MVKLEKYTLLTLFLFFYSVVDASTSVLVFELGKGGAVRRTSQPRTETNVDGVHSFWSNLHGLNKFGSKYKRQQPKMAIVPDMFKKPDGGIVIGLSGNGLDNLSVNALKDAIKSYAPAFIDNFELDGSEVSSLLDGEYVSQNFKEFKSNLKESVNTVVSSSSKHNFEVVCLDSVHGTDLLLVKSEIENAIESIKKMVERLDKTVVVHLAVQEGYELSRKLEDEEREEEEEQQNEEENAEEEQNQDAAVDDGYFYGNDGSLFYGYGFYLDSGEYYTPYRTMFQIHYFNLVVWSSVGLLLITLMSVQLTLNMPLMRDTLLFGESAKVVF